MERTLRQIAIPGIETRPWGTHICQFYRSGNDLFEILTPYFKAGLEGNEYCMWVTSPPLTVNGAKKAMERIVPDFDAYLRKGQMEILPHTDWYLKEGRFELQRVFAGWLDRMNAALAQGYDGIRVTGNTAWLEGEVWKDFVEYEETLNGVMENYPILAVCTYSLDRCGAYEVVEVVSNHRYVVIRREGAWQVLESAELRETEEERERAIHKLRAANRDLESFSYSVSHDLRVPLRAIDGFSRILLEDHAHSLDDEGKRLLQVVRDNTRKMGLLIEDILSFSRVGRLEVERSDIDMKALAFSVFEEIREANPGRDLRLRVESLPHARADRAMIRQVLQNLIANAVKFTRLRETAEIVVDGRVEGEENLYSIRDNGVGFDMAYAEKLFGIFQRLHRDDEFEGTGIGLALVKTIVAKHGGTVQAEGKVGDGAVFSFTLPRE